MLHYLKNICYVIFIQGFGPKMTKIKQLITSDISFAAVRYFTCLHLNRMGRFDKRAGAVSP